MITVARLENLTSFSALDWPSQAKDGRDVWVVCVAGRYLLPTPGTAPVLHQKQEMPPLEDQHFGDPKDSSLRMEGQSCSYRPGTDIYVVGSAWAVNQRATLAILVNIRVGRVEKSVLVVGDRTWEKGVLGLRLSSPRPFLSMPLVYERAFGGVSTNLGSKPLWEPRNPVGCGLYGSEAEANGRPVPNLEDPNQRISSFRDRPAPCGVGPIARAWQPRIGHAGTFDEAWVESRAPLWPKNFDERFFCAASPGLWSEQSLQGGEPVSLTGLSAYGRLDFTLPRVRLLATVAFNTGALRKPLVLDTVVFEPDVGTFTLIWRTAFPAHRRLAFHQSTTVRELAPWEAAT